MARVLEFPDRCSKCGQPSPTANWPVGRMEEAGGHQTTYSVRVPVCVRCRSELKRVSSRCKKVGVLTGFVFLGVVWIPLVLIVFKESATIGKPAGLVCAVVSTSFMALAIGALGFTFAGHATGLFFATIRRGGRGLSFASKSYQTEFDALNVLRRP